MKPENMKQTEDKAGPIVPRCLSVAMLRERTGLGRTVISQALNDGSLEHYRIGRRALIPEPAAAAWLNRHLVRPLRKEAA
jgi:excisionase family DNA binding protein